MLRISKSLSGEPSLEDTYGYVMKAADTAKAMTSGDAKAKQDAAVAAAITALALIPGAQPAMPFVSAMFGLTALLQQAFPAHGIISAGIVVGNMWDGPGGGEPPLLGVWKQAVTALQLTWDVARQSKGLPPAPFAMNSSFLRPLAPEDRAPTGLFGSLFGDSIIQGPDQCLLHWLNSYVKGWKTTKGCQQDLGKGRWSWVWNTEIAGPPEAGGNPVPGGDPNVWIGMGPFGIKTNNWPLDLNPNTQKQLAECVVDVWRYRLDALTKAVPELIGAIMVQVGSSKPSASFQKTSTLSLGVPVNARVLKMPKAKTGGGPITTYPCPVDHPYYKPGRPMGAMCGPNKNAYPVTIGGKMTGAYKCIGGATPVQGLNTLGKPGWICPSLPLIPSTPLKRFTPDATTSNKWVWIVAALAALGLVGGGIWYYSSVHGDA